MVCLKKMFNKEKIFHLKRILKRLCYYKWKVWYKLLSRSRQKIFFTRFNYPPNVLLRDIKYRGQKRLCSNTLKRNELKFILPWTKINWHVSQIGKARFRYTIWLIISKKGITRCTFIYCSGALLHQKSQQARHIQKNVDQKFQKITNTYILTEWRNFFSKEN